MNENFEKKITISFDVLFRYQFVVKIVEEISKKPEGFKIRLNFNSKDFLLKKIQGKQSLKS
jgi:hypothetical protein